MMENEVSLCVPHHGLDHSEHGPKLLMSGDANDLRISDENGRSILPLQGTGESEVALEAEAPPPEAAAPEEPLGPEPAAGRVELPAEVDRAFWRAHGHAFEWCAQRKILIFHPEAGEAAPETKVPVEATAGGEVPEFLGQKRIV
ncbi:MAG TPA: hypothetical protein VMC79_03475, partial [Rectinemataceae bacterium]|nr:hypothetical protein [Rectinemataceae bacterium]